MTTIDTTITHTIHVDPTAFRQALASALLFVSKDSFNVLNNICLHIETKTTFTVNSLDGHGFYRQRLPLLSAKDTADGGETVPPSLPNGESAWAEKGQLLIPAQSAEAILKLLPKKAKKGFTTLEVTPSNKLAYKQEVRFTGPDGSTFTFTASRMGYPDYAQFLSRVRKLKETPTTIQGHTFPAGEFARIAKALPEKFFNIYLGDSREAPCLAEQGETVIMYMPAKIAAPATWEDAA